jgi:UDP-N-acetylmuramoyl-L-alanyl-D-glutamate--2,6-diaminopimelate ligase
MADYVQAKLRAVQLVVPGGLVLINGADPRAGVFAHAAACRSLRVEELSPDPTLPVRLPGAFNAWNIAAAVRLAEALGVPRAIAVARLAAAPPPPGRLELLAAAPATYVDYAHTPESIANVIGAIRQAHPSAALAIVFGCGGDRDPSKRAPMGAAAAAADVVVITTDNSRSEAPAAIAAMIRQGIPAATVVIEEPDRAKAIRLARQRIGATGVVVVAGKGHETSQTIQGTTLPWDDRAFLRSLAIQP